MPHLSRYVLMQCVSLMARQTQQRTTQAATLLTVIFIVTVEAEAEAVVKVIHDGVLHLWREHHGRLEESFLRNKNDRQNK